jgi:hypothetical protein
MDFDYIIACGDSFTEGCCDLLGDEFGVLPAYQTWPGQVAKHFDVPFVNLAEGGASNYEIAIQPIQKIQKFITTNPPKKPLFIFGFTIDDRIPFFNMERGRVTSHFTTLPEYINGWDFGYTKRNSLLTEYLLIASRIGHQKFAHSSENLLKFQACDFVPVTDHYIHQTVRAIKFANNYKNLFADANVMWGFIHSIDYGNSVKTRRCISTDKAYDVDFPYWDRCFNRFEEHNRPLQWLTQDNKYWLTDEDRHPNKAGIKLYADYIIDAIEQLA